MKKMIFGTLAAMLLMSVNVQAQPPQGGRPGKGGEEFKMPEFLTDTVYAETKTAEMADKYQLSDEQMASVYALNMEYAYKLQMDPAIMGDRSKDGERKDPRSMTEEERQAFFQQMQERRALMEEAQAEIEDNQKAYDLAIKEIFTKDQYKQYKKDRKAQSKRPSQGGPGGRNGGGPGGPGNGGGFGGPGGGNFGGGNF